MARNHTILLLGLTAGAALVGGAGALLLSGPDSTKVAGPPSGPSQPIGSGNTGSGDKDGFATPVEPPAEAPKVHGVAPGTTTVAWAVKLELDLVQAAHLPQSQGVAPLGTGGTARFTGRIADGREQGVQATLRFLAGPNAPREIATNAEGKFGASDLYPGLSLVMVDGPGDLDAVREVRLRQDKETQLNLGFGLPGSVAGRVFDRDDRPLAEVQVDVDGQTQITDLEGKFLFTSVFSGLDLQLVLRKPGYASLSNRIAVTAKQRLDNLTYKLLPAATLEVAVPDRLGSTEDALVVIGPSRSNYERSYPWHLASPARVALGSSVTFTDLPAIRVDVRVFHAGAVPEPRQSTLNLNEGQNPTLITHLKAAPTLVGRVVDPEGLPVPDAIVRLEAPNRIGAELTYLGEMPGFLETEILPMLPVGVQETRANHLGEFMLTSWAEYAPARYLTAESPDGKLRAARLVKPEDENVQLDLQPAAGGTATLRLEFPGRFQALPVELSIRGAPRGEQLVPTDDALEIPDLLEGKWRLRATWNGRPIGSADGVLIDLDGDTTVPLSLPPGAIQGQDEDTRARAGRGTK
jgi:hypothetical protein